MRAVKHCTLAGQHQDQKEESCPRPWRGGGEGIPLFCMSVPRRRRRHQICVGSCEVGILRSRDFNARKKKMIFPGRNLVTWAFVLKEKKGFGFPEKWSDQAVSPLPVRSIFSSIQHPPPPPPPPPPPLHFGGFSFSFSFLSFLAARAKLLHKKNIFPPFPAFTGTSGCIRLTPSGNRGRRARKPKHSLIRL